MTKKSKVDVTNLDLSKAKLNALKKSIDDMSEMDIRILTSAMGRVAHAYDKRRELLKNTKMLLKIAALFAV
jgi:hypothetical protein